MKHIYFQLALSSFLGGVFLSNIFLDPFLIIYIILFFALVFISITLYIRQYRQYIFPLFIGVFIGFFCSLWTHIEIQKNLNILSNYLYQDVAITGTIIDIEKRNQESVEYRINIEKLSSSTNVDNMSSLLRIPSNFVLGVGDKISYTSEIYLIEDFDGFSYQNYMLSRGLYFRSYVSRFSRE
jgi:energy-coupling factor transporter transmembrane protein EcfT